MTRDEYVGAGSSMAACDEGTPTVEGQRGTVIGGTGGGKRSGSDEGSVWLARLGNEAHEGKGRRVAR